MPGGGGGLRRGGAVLPDPHRGVPGKSVEISHGCHAPEDEPVPEPGELARVSPVYSSGKVALLSRVVAVKSRHCV